MDMASEVVVFVTSTPPCKVNDRKTIDVMYDDVTHPERQYESCSHAQIQDGGQ